MSGGTVDIVIPQLGEGVAEVTLLGWLKKVGDPIEVGDVLFEVGTEKAVVEVEAFDSGVLEEILVEGGSSVMPTDVVGRLRIANP